jgi:hypothetical protein
LGIADVVILNWRKNKAKGYRTSYAEDSRTGGVRAPSWGLQVHGGAPSADSCLRDSRSWQVLRGGPTVQRVLRHAFLAAGVP